MKDKLIAFYNAYLKGTPSKVDPLAAELGLLESDRNRRDIGRSSNSMLQVLMGSIGTITDYHFPPMLIGGCCPFIPGEEQDIVWNAAADACDSERIHVAWNTKKNKIYYLAVSSDAMASHSHTWCPFASLLPGMPDAAVPPIIYTYFTDETATMMTVTEDAVQIHRGTTSVVRAKAERSSRELGDAPVVELVPDHINELQPAPWFSMSLFEDRARRILTTFTSLSAIAFGVLAFMIWLLATMSMVSSNTDLTTIRQRAEISSMNLMRDVQRQRVSPMRQQLAKFADINDGLLSLNGYLEIFTIRNDVVLWRAVVPVNVTSDRIKELGGQTLDTTEHGVIIGNAREALTAGPQSGRR